MPTSSLSSRTKHKDREGVDVIARQQKDENHFSVWIGPQREPDVVRIRRGNFYIRYEGDDEIIEAVEEHERQKM